MAHRQRKKIIARDQLHGMLLKNPGYRSLTAQQQSEISHSIARICNYLSTAPESAARQIAQDLEPMRRDTRRQGSDSRTSAFDDILESVDFPEFVSGLLNGVFGAIVDASTKQMEAYAGLIESVAKTVDDLMIKKERKDSGSRPSIRLLDDEK